MKTLPPESIRNFFRWYCNPKLADNIEGDLIEVYQRRLATMSKRKADFYFFLDVLLLLRPGIIRRRQRFQRINPYDMYKNYLTITFRTLNKDRLYSMINVFGLAIGFCSCLLIYLFIADELKFDKQHTDGDRIYRIAAAYMRQEQWEPYATNAWKTAEVIKNNYTEIEELVRVGQDNNTLFEYGDKRIVENRFAWVDDNFFKVFNFPLTQGNAAEALKGPNKVVISESMASKYFDKENPMGKVFILRDYPLELQVSGVMEDMPATSHFHFDFLISGETLRQIAPESLFTNVGWDSQYLYAKLSPDADPARMEATFPDFVDKNMDFWKSTTFKLFLQPLHDIHLKSNIGLELEPNGSMTRIYAFSVIAVFILVIACVNYMNLTTARSLRRAREVGMRKVLGAKKANLLNQFLTESFVMTFMATLMAIALCLVLLPSFNEFAGKQIGQLELFSPKAIMSLLLFTLFIAIASGSYPSVVLSSFSPLNSMKGKGLQGRSGLFFRKGLVVGQFVISIGLITASAIVFKQWNYMKNKPLGIDKDMLLCVPLQTMDRNKVTTFANELETSPAIKDVGFCNMRMPGWISNSTGYSAQDVNADEEVNKSMKIIRIDYEFLSTIGAQMAAGRNFSREFPSDSTSIILNESALEQLRWDEAIGKWISFGDTRYTVIGVVKDFHFESLHRKIPPTMFVYSPTALNWAYLKVDAREVAGGIEHVNNVFSRYVTDRDFSYTFVDEDVEQQYVAEQKFMEVFSLFTGLAIVIAALGTFGLISFSAERKAKEIGIRKVLGASTGSVSFLLIKEFIVLLLIASAIAWPVAYYFTNGWIEAFTYRTTINAVPFIAATAIAAIIVVLTTGFRALKAALANPVDSLRNE